MVTDGRVQQSHPNGGYCLPILKEDAPAATGWKDMTGKRNKILIVDDEPLNIQFLKTSLELYHQVFTAPGGAEALLQVREHAPDLVLLDVIMPGMNGFEVARAIKGAAASSAIPIIFLTVMDTLEAESEGLESGGIDYLTKPFNLKLLRLRVNNHLELKRRSDLIREQRDLVTRQKEELEASMARVKRLEGMISICMHCKNIRNDDASWQEIERYLTEHTDARFSHCICPSCHEQHYL
jgi:DNA-binding response OmpR family regulator